jgi:hypothetical protein
VNVKNIFKILNIRESQYKQNILGIIRLSGIARLQFLANVWVTLFMGKRNKNKKKMKKKPTKT